MKTQMQRMIHLDDMIRYLITKWRYFLLAAIAVAVVFGALGIYKVQKKYAGDSDESQKTEVTVSESELDDVEAVLYYEKAIQNQREYNEHSILMKIDPLKKAVAVVKYQFQISEAKTDAALSGSWLKQGEKIYEGIVLDDECLAYIKSEAGLQDDEKYIKELITTDISSEGIIVYNIVATDEDMAKQISLALQTYLSEHQTNLLKGLDSLEVKKVSESVQTVIDMGLQATQTNYYNNLEALQTTLSTRETEMSSRAKEYRELCREDYMNGTYQSGQTVYKVSASSENVSNTRRIKDVLLYVFKRELLLLALLAMAFAAKYMWSPRLMYAGDLQDMYGMESLCLTGVVHPGEEMKRIAEIAVAFVGDNEKMLLISSNMEAQDPQLLEQLQQAAQQRGIVVQNLGNLFDSEVLQQLKSVKKVVMIERLGTSRYSEIQRLVELTACLDCKIKAIVSTDK